MSIAKFVPYVPAIVFFALGAVVQFRFVRTRKYGSLFMGAFFDGLGVWWIVKALHASPQVVKWVLIASFVAGALGLLSDALNIGGKDQRSDTR